MPRASVLMIFTVGLGLLVLLASQPLLADQPEAMYVTLEVRIADMPPATITVAQDEVASLSFANADFKVGLAPRGTTPDKVELETLVLFDHSSIEFFDTLEIQPGSVVSSSRLPVTLTTRIVEIRQLPRSNLAGGPTKVDPGIGITTLHDSLLQKEHRCCVTCGETTACGCAVSMDCGSCCSGPCC